MTDFRLENPSKFNGNIGGTIGSGTDGSILFIHPNNTLAQDNANLNYNFTKKFTGIQQSTPQGPLHVSGVYGQTVDAPASLSAVLALDPQIPTPTSATATQVYGPPDSIPSPSLAFTYIDQVYDPWTLQSIENSGAGSVFLCGNQTISGTIYAYKLANGGTQRVINPNGIGWSCTDTIGDFSSYFTISIGASGMTPWATANGYQDGFIVTWYDPYYGVGGSIDVGNVYYYTLDGTPANDSYLMSAYPSNGSTWTGTSYAYKVIAGLQYIGAGNPGSNTDGSVGGAYMIITSTVAAPSGYDGTFYGAPDATNFDMGPGLYFDDWGQGGVGLPASFVSVAFPPFNTSISDSSFNFNTQNDGGGSYTANNTLYNYHVYEYNTHPLTGIKYYTSGYSFSFYDNNDGQPFTWNIDLTAGSGAGRLVVVSSDGGFTFRQQDIGSATNFNDDGSWGGGSLGPIPLISGYTGFAREFRLFGYQLSPAKYSVSYYTYNFIDDNTAYYLIKHDIINLNGAPNDKLIEVSDLGTRNINTVTAAGVGTFYEFINSWDGNLTVLPNVIGYLSNGSNLNITYTQYAYKNIGGIAVYSLASPSATVTDPNDGNYYTVTVTGSAVSGAVYIFKGVGGVHGSAQYYNVGSTSFSDSTLIGWSNSQALTPNTGPTSAAIFERALTFSYTETPIVSYRNTNSGQSFGFNAFYHTSGGGVYNEFGRYGVTNTGMFAIDSFNHGLEIGTLGTPHTAFYQSNTNNPGAYFNAQANNQYALLFRGGSQFYVMWCDAQSNTVYFGTNYSNIFGGDPNASVAISPVGSDKAIVIVNPNSNSPGSDSVQILSKDTSNTWWGVSTCGRFFSGRTTYGNGWFNFGGSQTATAQISSLVIDNSFGLPNPTNAGGIERYDNGGWTTPNATNASQLLWTDKNNNRFPILTALNPSTTQYNFWRSDSNGMPIADSTIQVNSGGTLTIFNTRDVEFKVSVTLDAGKSLGIGSNLTITGNGPATIATSTSSGLKIATSTSQKLGFYNAAPVVQQSGNIITGLNNLGLFTSASLPASSVSSGAALTKTDDTNVTMTLGGTPSTALLVAASMTLGWTGTLAVSRGGTGAGTLSSGQVLLGNGTSAINSSTNFVYSGGILSYTASADNSDVFKIISNGSSSKFFTIKTESSANAGLIGYWTGASFGQIGYYGTSYFDGKVNHNSTVNLKNYTVATLPAGTRGDVCYVTDALAPSFLVAVVGGGTVVTEVFYNGTTWVAS